MNKRPITIRISSTGLAVAAALGERLGLDRSAVIELSLRRLAGIEGIDVSSLRPATPASAVKSTRPKKH